MKLRILGTSGKLLRILRSTYEDLTAKVRIGGMTSESIVVMKGVRQGGVMSGFYYLVYILMNC